jgi:hypothetical protein
LPLVQSWPAAEAAADRQAGGQEGRRGLENLQAWWRREAGGGQGEAEQTQAPGDPLGKYVPLFARPSGIGNQSGRSRAHAPLQTDRSTQLLKTWLLQLGKPEVLNLGDIVPQRTVSGDIFGG